MIENRKNKKKYPYLWAVIYSIILVGYTVFTLLDAFVIPKDLVYVDDLPTEPLTIQQERDISDFDSNEEDSYQSDNISIKITTYREYDTQIYIADVIIKDISYLRAGLAGKAFGRNIGETTSDMAKQNNAILAINGDYYGFRDKGFVMRNKYLYRDIARNGEETEALIIYEDGSFEVIEESDADANDLAEKGAVHIFSFGPGLIQNGEIIVDQYSEVEHAMRSNPRTAIGIIEPLHYILAVSDGRTEESEGLTLNELAQVLQNLGCQCAYNLDGGGSSTMWFMGKVINVPTNGRRLGERSVSDIVYIGE